MNEPAEWFIARKKQKTGPFTWTQLVDQVSRGDIGNTDMLLRQGAGKWVQAESVPGLFAAPQAEEALPTPTAQPDVTVSLVAPTPDQVETVTQGMPPPATVAFGSGPKVPAELAGSVPGYEFLGILGRGGMGVVYKARHLALQRVVALKMILAANHAGSDDLERFRIEAQAVARLQHPNIVQIHEVGEHDGRPFFSLEFADGGTLAARIKGDPWSPRQAAELAEQLARAMQHAHEHGIIHRDLKPGNVLFAADGTPKVTDFGLAKQLDADQNLSQTGAILGTPSYMAPEQAEGKSDIGPAADVYALGVILYELLTGRPPFKGATLLDTLEQVRSQEPVPPTRLARVPIDLETICLKCLHKSPKQRYDSAAELGDDLNRFLRGEPVRARPIGNLARGWRWCLRNRMVASLLAAAAVSLLGGIIVSVGYGIKADRSAADAEANERVAKEQEKLAREETDRANEKEKLAQVETTRANEKEKLARDETVRANKAKDEAILQFNRAEAALDKLSANLFTSQILRVSMLWEREPLRARALLQDVNACPPERRDLAWRHFNQATTYEIFSAPGGGSGAVCFSADGQTLFAAGDTNRRSEIRRVDLRTGKDLNPIVAHKELNRLFNIKFLVLGPDGKTLVSGGADGTIKLWNADTGEALATLTDHTTPPTCLAFSPDGATFASGDSRGSVILWDAAKRAPIKTLSPHTARVNGLDFSPGGKTLAIAYLDQRLELLDLETGKARSIRIPQPSRYHPFYKATFTADGKHLLYGGGGVFKIDVQTGENTLLSAEREPFGQLELSKDGKTIVVAAERKVMLMDAVTGRTRLILHGHDAQVNAIALSRDGTRIASTDFDNGRREDLKVWDLARGGGGTPHRAALDPVQCAAVANDGHVFATGNFIAKSGIFHLKIWDRTQGLRHHIKVPTAYGQYNRLAFFPDGKRLLLRGNSNSSMLVFDVATGQRLGELPGAHHFFNISQDGKRIATSTAKEIFIVNTSGLSKVVAMDSTFNRTLALSPDGQILYSDNKFLGPEICVWNANTGQKLDPIRPRQAIKSFVLSPDGAVLAIEAMGRDIHLWDVQRKAIITSLPPNTHELNAMSLSKDNKTLITVTEASIKFWDLPSKQERAEIALQRFLGFSPDGQSFVATDTDGNVRIWTPHTLLTK